MTVELLARNLAAHWMQSGFLAAAAMAAILLLDRREPRFRLVALRLVLLAIVLLPLIQPWRAEVEPLPVASDAVAIDGTAVLTTGGIAAGQAGMFQRFNPTRGLVMVILAGIAMRLLWLGYGVLALMRFSRRSSAVPLPAVAADLETRLRVSPRYIQQTGNRGPWTFGFFRSTVALPAGFDSLAPAFQRAVICHELLHVKRRDMAMAFAEEVVVAMLWFHPWVWLLRARIRVAREQVVDRNVVTLIGDRDEYVRCLVEISGHDLAPYFSQAGAGMLRPRELRARVDAIFQEGFMSRARIVTATVTLLAVVAMISSLAARAVPLRAPYVPYVVSGFSQTVSAQAPAAEAPRRQTKMGFAEYPVDALEKGIRGTVMVAITVNSTGQVTTAAVVSGPQELRASAFKAAMGWSFRLARQ